MKVSIVTAIYNRKKTLEATVQSVLRQTYKDIEYIIVDGGSEDGSLDIIRQYEPQFEGRMRWVSEPDRGIYDAMNKGLAIATGDVVGILNSDDFFTSDDVIETIVGGFGDADAVYGDVHFIEDENLNCCVRYYSSRSFVPWKLRFGFMPAHPSFYVRKSLIEKYGGYSLDYKIASDYDFMVRMFYVHKIKAHYIPKDCVVMRVGGVSTNNLSNRWLISKEDVVACRRNGMYTNIVMICVKYFVKIFEFTPKHLMDMLFSR